MLLVGTSPPGANGLQTSREDDTSAGSKPAPVLMVDYIVAKVNDEIITRRDLEKALSRVADETGGDEFSFSQVVAESPQRILRLFDAVASGGGAENSELSAMRATLQALIDRTLLRQVASRQLGASRLDSIRAAVDRYYLRRQKGTPAGDAEVTAGTIGAEMDRRIFEALLRKNVSIDRDAVTPSTIRAYYYDNLDAFRIPAKVTFRHLLIRPDETPSDKGARAWARVLRAKLLAGADFSEVTRKHSHGPRAAEGGLWQHVDPKTWRLELAAWLTESPLGEVSDVVESEIGLHIVQVLERAGSRTRSFDEVQASIKNNLYWRLADDAIESWLAEIAQDAYVWSLLDLHGVTLLDR